MQNKLLLHAVGIVFYFPVVVVMFLYFLLNPSKLNDFYLGIEVLLGIWSKAKEVQKNKRRIVN